MKSCVAFLFLNSVVGLKLQQLPDDVAFSDDSPEVLKDDIQMAKVQKVSDWTPRRSMPSVTSWALMGSCNRGTGVAMYDYADHAETLLNLPRPYIFCVAAPGDSYDRSRFVKRFGDDRILDLSGWPRRDVDRIIAPYNLSHIYYQKAGGSQQTMLSKRAMNLVHAVFDGSKPHGDRYAKIAPVVPGNMAPVVPYMVTTWPKSGDHLREKLNIPSANTVICRYGGHKTFDIEYVHEAIIAALDQRSDINFLFANTDAFTSPTDRIRFLPPMLGDEKATFVRTCDAMIHARKDGETFGLAVAEFAMMGQRVITENVSPDHVHMVELKERALLYHDYQSVLKIFINFDRNAKLDPSWDGYSKYHPEKVMKRFHDIFFSDL